MAAATPPMPREQREFRIDPRGWAGMTSLDPGAHMDTFVVWRERAMMHLSQGRVDVRKLLQWAEKQSAATIERDAAGFAQSLGMVDFDRVDYLLYGGIMHTIGNALLGRARACDDRGALLWHTLCAERVGSSAQYSHAKARTYLDPAQAKDVGGLWTALPAWERLGAEVHTVGFATPSGSRLQRWRSSSPRSSSGSSRPGRTWSPSRTVCAGSNRRWSTPVGRRRPLRWPSAPLPARTPPATWSWAPSPWRPRKTPAPPATG